MKNPTVNFEVLKAVLNRIVDFTKPDLEALGITEEQLELTTQEAGWGYEQRNLVTRCLVALLHGTTEQLALPKINLPAEYVAACLVAVVHPANLHAACSWLSSDSRTGAPAQAMASGQDAGPTYENVSASQLMALCCEAMQLDRTTRIRQDMAAKLGIELSLAERNANNG